MTSKVQEQACYVYITLPGEEAPITAGRFVLTLDRRGIPFGRFIYGKSYLQRENAVALDPIELKLMSHVYETTGLNGIFGSLRDAGPDYWGRSIIQRYCEKKNLNELDYLLYSSDDRIGALGFGLNQTPPAPIRKFNQTIDLEKLQNIADAFVREEEIQIDDVNHQVEDLLLVGTSMGGARPKAVVEDNTGLWIAKFNRYDDLWNQARVEHAMLTLAVDCGLTAAESRVVTIGGRDVLLVKRFDRVKTPSGYLRARMISALTLLRAEDTYQSRDRWSYINLAEELRRISAEPAKDAKELFRRMCFNALISNIDDHPRNHAVIATDKNWRLSPAYDLTPAVPISLERRDLAMICGDQGRFANQQNLLSQSARFFLTQVDAVNIINQMKTQINNNWYSIARRAGVNEKDCAKIAPAFVYTGFN